MMLGWRSRSTSTWPRALRAVRSFGSLRIGARRSPASFRGKRYFNVKGVSIPVAVSVFPDELYPAPRSWAEKAYPNMIHYNKLPTGGHFAGWEQPKFLSEEMRAGFRSLRK